jgi:hypothetical protein
VNLGIFFAADRLSGIALVALGARLALERRN